MEEKFKFTTEELAELQRIATHLKTTMVDTLEPDDEKDRKSTRLNSSH